MLNSKWIITSNRVFSWRIFIQYCIQRSTWPPLNGASHSWVVYNTLVRLVGSSSFTVNFYRKSKQPVSVFKSSFIYKISKVSHQWTMTITKVSTSCTEDHLSRTQHVILCWSQSQTENRIHWTCHLYVLLNHRVNFCFSFKESNTRN